MGFMVIAILTKAKEQEQSKKSRNGTVTGTSESRGTVRGAEDVFNINACETGNNTISTR